MLHRYTGVELDVGVLRADRFEFGERVDHLVLRMLKFGDDAPAAADFLDTCSAALIDDADELRAAYLAETDLDRLRDIAETLVSSISAVWAREVLRDPAAMMLALLRADGDKVIVHGEDIAGEVLFDHVMSLADVPDKIDVLMGKCGLSSFPRGSMTP